MSLPEQIQKQVDAAKDIISQHYGIAEADNAATAPVLTGAAQAAPAKEPAPEIPPAAAAPTAGDDKTYEQRWRSLQGSYNATTQRLQATEARMRDMEELLTTLQAAPKTEQTAPVAHKLITSADTEGFGEEMVDMVRRAAREEMTAVATALSALRDEVAALKGLAPVVNTVAANQRVTAQERFFQSVAREVPGWETINGDSNFHNWLLTPDPMTGLTRQTYLEDAQRSNDAPRVASIFKAWGQVNGSSSATPAPSQPNHASSELESQIAPGRQVASIVPSTSPGRQWTTKGITEFYEAVRRGQFKGQEAERAAMEQDLFIAQREGRVTRLAA